MREEITMRRVVTGTAICVAGVVLVAMFWQLTLAQTRDTSQDAPLAGRELALFLEHRGSAPDLERPAVAFDHDRHTSALKQAKMEDCGICHTLRKGGTSTSTPGVRVFDFPKAPVDWTDKTSVMYGFHEACVGCHDQLASEGKKTGPRIGLCGSCHVRRPFVERATWKWSPIFDYKRHHRHQAAVEKLVDPAAYNIAGKVELIEPSEGADQRCYLCHHQYNPQETGLLYKKDTANACGACHKEKTEKNVRSMKTASHAACIGCHVKAMEEVKSRAAAQGRADLSEDEKKRFGPFECKGCHGERKELTPEEIRAIPRLVRGQKDVMDLALTDQEPAGLRQPSDAPPPKIIGRMKTVGFNHKAHEPRAQFCSTCHHRSLEKCGNCHTVQGDPAKGGGVSFWRAFHKVDGSQSCAGCHASAKEAVKCAGCHQVSRASLPQASCPVCHRGPVNGVPIDAPAQALVFDKEKVPEKLEIKALEKEFKPAALPHQKIVARLTTISNENSLARVFHAGMGDQTLCSGCHHASEPSAAQEKKVPACTSCHGAPFQPGNLGKPGILGAYHRQCIGCHDAMQQKPAALECVKCHPAREDVKTAGAQEKLGMVK